MRILSQTVPTVIDGFKNGGGVRTMGTFSMTLPDGTHRQITDQEATAMVLEEFYNTVQVMVGEAISISELKDFLTQAPWASAAKPTPPAKGKAKAKASK